MGTQLQHRITERTQNMSELDGCSKGSVESSRERNIFFCWQICSLLEFCQACQDHHYRKLGFNEGKNLELCLTVILYSTLTCLVAM